MPKSAPLGLPRERVPAMGLIGLDRPAAIVAHGRENAGALMLEGNGLDANRHGHLREREGRAKKLLDSKAVSAQEFDQLTSGAATSGADIAAAEAAVRAMAEGALARSRGDIALAVTGFAGPGIGATPGLVHFALAARDGATIHRRRQFIESDRAGVRWRAIETVLAMLRERLF